MRELPATCLLDGRMLDISTQHNSVPQLFAECATLIHLTEQFVAAFFIFMFKEILESHLDA